MSIDRSVKLQGLDFAMRHRIPPAILQKRLGDLKSEKSRMLSAVVPGDLLHPIKRQCMIGDTALEPIVLPSSSAERIRSPSLMPPYGSCHC